jgi:hypothetical protein
MKMFQNSHRLRSNRSKNIFFANQYRANNPRPTSRVTLLKEVGEGGGNDNYLGSLGKMKRNSGTKHFMEDNHWSKEDLDMQMQIPGL